ncbi:MAG: hypothetical protein ACR2MB_10820, partial [Acidimicrobiales bacterium]
MDLDFGHGFIPRIGEENYKAVDRCVGPTDLFSSALDLPWAIVDGAWAERKPELLGTLREHGTKLLIDTHGWRFRHDTALDVEKLRAASWAPASPMSPVDKTAGAAFVQTSLRAQAQLEAGAYFLPGWLPATPGEDLRPAYAQIVATARQFADMPPRPFVLFVGGHTKGLDQVVTLLEDLPHFVSGIYLQMTPVAPMRDGPSKLETLTSIYRHAASLGFKVIAGHAGAVTPVLRALASTRLTPVWRLGRASTSPRRSVAPSPKPRGRSSAVGVDRGCTSGRSGDRSKLSTSSVCLPCPARRPSSAVVVCRATGSAATTSSTRPESTRFGRGSRRRSSLVPCRRACGRRPSTNASRVSVRSSPRSTV